jgi:hypothetical protein
VRRLEQRRRAVQLAATMVITAVLAVGIASADPVNSKNTQFITLNCGSESLQVVTIENNRVVVVNGVGTTSIFVIKSIEESSTSTDPQSEQQGELTICTTDGLTVTGFFTP